MTMTMFLNKLTNDELIVDKLLSYENRTPNKKDMRYNYPTKSNETPLVTFKKGALVRLTDVAKRFHKMNKTDKLIDVVEDTFGVIEDSSDNVTIGTRGGATFSVNYFELTNA